MSKLIHVDSVIKGAVQGVGYRWFATRLAAQYNVTGSIANLPNGDVEAIVEGEEGMVRDFLKELRIGPPYASVTAIDVKEGTYTGKYKGFGVQYS